MSRKILVCHAEGLGNCIELVPAIRTLKEVLGYDIDYWHAFSGFKLPKVIPYVDNWFVGNEIRKANLSSYSGCVSTFWTRAHVGHLGLPVLTKIVPLTMDRSEVDTYMQIARDLGAKEEDLIWHGNINYSIRRDTKVDIVVMNGYNPYGSANWSIKGYPNFKVVISMLKEKGYSVASIGAPGEYIKGSLNFTGMPLKESFGVIKQSRLLISNDTGMYHAANALEVKNIVLFTATSVAKNFDPRFHKFSKIITRKDLLCRPCQKNRRWTKDCKIWECQNIDPKIIVDKAVEMINEQKSDGQKENSEIYIEKTSCRRTCDLTKI